MHQFLNKIQQFIEQDAVINKQDTAIHKTVYNNAKKARMQHLKKYYCSS